MSSSSSLGGNYHSSTAAGATYTFSQSLIGKAEVALRWVASSSRCPSVKVQVYNGSTLLRTKTVNQQQNGGRWNALGTFPFSGSARVRITSTGGCSTCVDAVKLGP